MATQYTTILKLALPTQGELSGTWGDVVNDNITAMVEEAIAGRKVINTWTTNSHTLTTADGTTSESRAAILTLTDTGTVLTGAGTVICPAASKIYVVENGTGQTITVKTSSGTGIAVPNGKNMVVFCDGTNVEEGITNINSLTLNGDGATVSSIKDEDNMASDSATALATQQSIKAYVDSQVGTVDTLAEILANGNTTGGTDIAVGTGDDITFADSSKAIFGAGSDLQMYHSGTESWIKDAGTGNLYIDTDGTSVLLTSGNSAKNMVRAVKDGAVTAYYDNTARLATTSTGIAVTGNVVSTGVSGSSIIQAVGADSNGFADVEIKSTGTTGGSRLFFSDTAAQSGFIKYSHNGNSMEFGTGGAERMRIDSSGNLLVGKSSSAFGTAGSELQSDGAVTLTRDGGTVFFVNRLTSDGEILSLSKDSAQIGSIGSTSGSMYIQGNTATGKVGLTFYGSSIEPRDSGAAADNAVDLGASGTRFKDLYLSGTAYTGLNIHLQDSGTTRGKIELNASDTDDLDIKAVSLGSNMKFFTVDTERMRIDSGGNAIFTKANGAYLQLKDASAVRGAINVETSDGLVFTTGASFSERMRIDASGNVGIGQSSPSSYYAKDLVVGSGSAEEGITIRGSSSGRSYLMFADGTSGNEQYRGYLAYNHADDSLEFATGASQRMRITDAGIDVTGTITFDGGTTSADLNFGDNNKAVFGAGSDLLIFHDGSSSVIRDSGTGNLAIQAEDFAVQSADASATHIFVDASSGYTALNYGGSTKLNTSSTGIDVTGNLTVDAGSNGKIEFGNITTNYGRLYADSTGTFVGSVTADPLIFRTTNTERMRISSAGNVGIGTSNTSSNKFTVSDDSADGTQVRIVGATDENHRLSLGFDTTNLVGKIQAVHAGTAYKDLALQSEGGNVGIGTSSPNQLLTLGSSTGTATIGLDFETTNVSRGSILYNAAAGEMAFTSGYSGYGGYMTFDCNGSERMRIDSSGNVKVKTGDLQIGESQANSGSGRYVDIYNQGTDSATFSILRLIRQQAASTSLTTSEFYARKNGETTIWNFEPSSAGYLRAGVGSTEGWRINSSGNVGIGDSNPDTGLTIGSSFLTNSVAGASVKVKAIASSSILEIGQDGNNSALLTLTNSSGTETIRAAGHNGALTITGALSKGSGSFKIDHPLPSKTDTHHLVHSFVEAPQADNIYRGKVDLIDGSASVNIDAVAGMTEGTFVLLNRDVQCFTSNESGWTAVKGSVSGNILTITAQDNTCTDAISWLVIGERQDQHMHDTDWTDSNGKVIVEPSKGD